MRLSLPATLVALVVAPGLAQAPGARADNAPLEGAPSSLTNARLETRVLSGSLGAAVGSEGRGPAWIGYRVASLRNGHGCCFDSVREARVRPRGGCRLEGGQGARLVRGSGCGGPRRSRAAWPTPRSC